MLKRHRSRSAAVALALALAVPAQAAADPLVSGYGGPGSGDQDVLGSTLLPAGSGPGGTGRPPSLRATPAAPASASPLPATAAAPVPPAAAAAGAGSGTAGVAGEKAAPRPQRLSARHKAAGGRLTPAATASAPTAAAPAATTAPLRPGASTSAGVLPVAGGDLLTALAVLLGLGVLGLASRRLVHADGAPA